MQEELMKRLKVGDYVLLRPLEELLSHAKLHGTNMHQSFVEWVQKMENIPQQVTKTFNYEVVITYEPYVIYIPMWMLR